MKKSFSVPFFDLSRFYKDYQHDISEITNKVFSSGYLMDGESIKSCEQKISELYKYNETVMVGSCTDALYFALLANQILPGDEVIVTSYSFIATLSPIIRIGAIPVFVDIDLKTGLMDLNDIENKITPKTKAIIVVHLYGQLVDMQQINAIAESYHLCVVEDAAQSIGVFPNYGMSKKSECICLSFDPTKVVHAFGSGGAVICRDKNMAIQIRQLRYHGKNANDFDYLGYNSRITEQQAALILFQLEMIDLIINSRREIAEYYYSKLSLFEQIKTPELSANCNYHKFVILVNERDKIVQHLINAGIQVMVHYPKGLFEYKLNKNSLNKYLFPNTNQFAKKVISLPIYWGMGYVEIDFIVEELRGYFNR